MMKLPSNNKKGITLVEVVIGVFVLSIFAVGILSLLVYNNQAVSDSTVKKADYSTVVQKMDVILAAVSNTVGPDNLEFKEDISYLELKDGNIHLDIEQLRSDFDMADPTVWAISYTLDPATPTPLDPLRGWYIKLTYTVNRDGVDHVTEITGYTSYSQGAFDEEDAE